MATRWHRRSLGFAVSMSLAGLPGCGTPTSPGTPVSVEHVSSAEVTFPVTAELSGSQVPAQHRLVSDSATWAVLWSQLFGRSASSPPAVDFSQSVVLFTAMGSEPSTGYATSITKATAMNGQLIVEVSEVSPGVSCAVAAVITHPADAVVVPRGTTTSVNFSVTRTTGCGS